MCEKGMCYFKIDIFIRGCFLPTTNGVVIFTIINKSRALEVFSVKNLFTEKKFFFY